MGRLFTLAKILLLLLQHYCNAVEKVLAPPPVILPPPQQYQDSALTTPTSTSSSTTTTTSSTQNRKIYSQRLYPTSIQSVHHEYHRHLSHLIQQQQQSSEDIEDIIIVENDIHEQIIHPYTMGVYAGLEPLPWPPTLQNPQQNQDQTTTTTQKLEQQVRQHNSLVRQFQKDRQSSRFERYRRDLQHKQERRRRHRQLEHNIVLRQNQNDPEEEEHSMEGGLYNDEFQSAPLSQGIGTHYTTVWVGSPDPQRLTLIADTGSHHTAFPCEGCKDCGSYYHTDNYFQPAQSKTFHKLSCTECGANSPYQSSTECISNSCELEQSYAEASSWLAYLASDEFTCGDNHMYDKSIQEKFTMPFVFGCQTKITGMFRTQLADGIIGFSDKGVTLPKQMKESGKIDHAIFTMCFRREIEHTKEGISAGILTLGGIDTRLHESPLVFAKLYPSKNGWYTVHMKKIWVDNDDGGQDVISADQKGLNNGNGVIVDSGTTDTYLQTHLLSNFQAIWKKTTPMAYFANRSIKLTKEQLEKFPTIMIQLEFSPSVTTSEDEDPDQIKGMAGTKIAPNSPRDVILSIPPSHYMEYSKASDSYTPRIYFSERSGGVIGANAMMGHDVVFDPENKRVGFAESSCHYDEIKAKTNLGADAIEDNSDNHDIGEASSAVDVAGHPKNCALGEPVQVKSCADTVDESLCVDSTDKLVEKGIETWSMVIIEPGNKEGVDCVDEVKNRIPNLPLNAAPFCNGDGLCSVSYPCIIDCNNLQKDKNKETEKSDSIDDISCDKGWSDCQFSCHQTRIHAEPRSDGVCHELSVESRVCHIDACGSVDPCRVPYVVHAIFGFASADTFLWTKEAEELFVESLALTVDENEPTKDEKIFGPGDVNVLITSPWENDEEGKDSLGMKVVVEISVFNAEAVIPNLEDIEIDDMDINTENYNSTKQREKTLMDKVKTIMHAVTGPPMAICKESDVYSLSKTALDVHVELERPEFMSKLVSKIGRQSLATNVAAPVFEKVLASNGEKSILLSSWTVKTEVQGVFSSDGKFQGINKATAQADLDLLIVFSLFVFCICYTGACFGSFCTRRRLAQEKIMQHLRNKQDENKLGKYAKVGSASDDVDDDVELAEISKNDTNLRLRVV